MQGKVVDSEVSSASNYYYGFLRACLWLCTGAEPPAGQSEARIANPLFCTWLSYHPPIGFPNHHLYAPKPASKESNHLRPGQLILPAIASFLGVAFRLSASLPQILHGSHDGQI